MAEEKVVDARDEDDVDVQGRGEVVGEVADVENVDDVGDVDAAAAAGDVESGKRKRRKRRVRRPQHLLSPSNTFSDLSRASVAEDQTAVC